MPVPKTRTKKPYQHGKNTALHITDEERRVAVLEKRLTGKLHQEIADEMGVNSFVVAQDLEHCLAQFRVTQNDLVEEYFATTVMRYEAILKAWWGPAMKNSKAAGIVLATLRDMRQLTGIDTPTPQAPPSIPVYAPIQINVTSTSVGVQDTRDGSMVVDAVPNVRLGGDVPPDTG